MREYAKRQFWLNQTIDGAKITNRQNLERVAEQTGRDPMELFKLPEVPPEVLYLFGWFCELKTGETLTYNEIAQWNKLKGNNIQPNEVEVLMALDSDFYKTQKDARINASSQRKV